MKYSFFYHPNSACMSYWEHFNFSFSLSLLFAKGFYKAIIHAVFPNFFITSSSDISKHISEKIHKSGCNEKN